MKAMSAALSLRFLMAGMAAMFVAPTQAISDDVTVSSSEFHRVKIGEIELHIPNTVEFLVPGEGVIRPGDPLFSGSISERYVKFNVDQILHSPSPGSFISIGGLENPRTIDLYCQYFDDVESNTKKWHRRVGPDGVVIYNYRFENLPDYRPEDRENYLKLDSKILNRPVFIVKLSDRAKGSPFNSYRLSIALSSNVNLEISFTDADLPRPTWPAAFATIDKTLSQWIQRSDASNSGQPQPFKVDECPSSGVASR